MIADSDQLPQQRGGVTQQTQYHFTIVTSGRPPFLILLHLLHLLPARRLPCLLHHLGSLQVAHGRHWRKAGGKGEREARGFVPRSGMCWWLQLSPRCVSDPQTMVHTWPPHKLHLDHARRTHLLPASRPTHFPFPRCPSNQPLLHRHASPTDFHASAPAPGNGKPSWEMWQKAFFSPPAWVPIPDLLPLKATPHLLLGGGDI